MRAAIGLVVDIIQLPCINRSTNKIKSGVDFFMIIVIINDAFRSTYCHLNSFLF